MQSEQRETVREAYLRIRRRLGEAGVPDAAVSASVLLQKHTGLSRHEVVLRGGEPLRCDAAALDADVERRAAREPLQYIVGRWPFFGLEFAVGPGVLIPRPDTEVLCEVAAAFLQGRFSRSPAVPNESETHPRGVRLLDLCAGSGCVGIAAAVGAPGGGDSLLWCVEVSDAALPWLRRNLALYGMAARAQVVQADMLNPETPALLPREFDALLCNPPYIPAGDIGGLEPEVARFEPRLALDGGADGLDFYRAAERYLPLLAPGGLAAFEVGAGQAGEVAALLRSFGLQGVFVKKDYGGVERVVGGIRAEGASRTADA